VPRPGSVRAARAAAARRQFLAVISNKPAAGASANLAPGLERPMCVRAECPVHTYLPGRENISGRGPLDRVVSLHSKLLTCAAYRDYPLRSR
jgi:hypothetical protein